MLLTVFKTQESTKLDLGLLDRINAQQIDNSSYLIKEEGDSISNAVDGLLLQRLNQTLLVWETYDVERATNLSLRLCQKLNWSSVFVPYIFSDELFLNWINISSQLIECGFESDTLGERKIAAFDLKKSEKFTDLFKKIKIKMVVFTLKEQNVLITARREGRISITPDIDNKKLVSILNELLTNGITMVANR